MGAIAQRDARDRSLPTFKMMGPRASGPPNFGYLTVSKIVKFVATRHQILGLKCTKFNFCWGSAPDLTSGA